jgi:hypothetical protein
LVKPLQAELSVWGDMWDDADIMDELISEAEHYLAEAPTPHSDKGGPDALVIGR